MYPEDIDAQSGCRLPLVERADLDAELQGVFDLHVVPGAHTIRGLRGPGGVQMHSPELAKRNRPVGLYLRSEAAVPGRVREVAILVTARCCGSRFEWVAHEAEALKNGVPRATIETIRNQGPGRCARSHRRDRRHARAEIFTDRKVGSQTYARALETFGKRPLVDLVALMGYYAATAALLTAFDMQLDPGVAEPFAI